MAGDLQPGDPVHVGRYRMLGRLGSGGMGQVFLGESPGGRLVAVKLIRSDLAERPDFRVRFAREVMAARRVGGIFTTPVVDADAECEHPFLVTAYVPGPSLAEAIEAQGPMPAEWVVRLAAGLAEGLHAIHAADVVHRDLKPSNVLLSPDGPRIIDFGISRPMHDAGLTSTGSVIGSPGFMSPEQAQGRPVGPPTDIFSLGSVLTFAATGEGPFGSGVAAVLLYRIVHTAGDLSGVPGQIKPLIERCLDKDAAARPTAEVILAELAAPPMPPVPPAPPRSADNAGPATITSGPSPQPSLAIPSPAATRRRPGLPTRLIVTAAAVVAVALSALAIVHLRAHALPRSSPAVTAHHGRRDRPAPSPPASSPALGFAAPATVVRAYLGAINRRDYATAWHLGGDNLGEPYSTFVAGFTKTSRVVVTSLHTSGTTVNVRTTAYETTGQVQYYALSYVVENGTIVSGQATLLRTAEG